MVPDGCIYGQEVADILGVENVNSVWRIIRRSAARYRKETEKEVVIYQGVDCRARRYVQRADLEAFAEWRKAGPEQAADLERQGYIYGEEIARGLRMNSPKEAWVSIRRNLPRYQEETGNQFEPVYANRCWYVPREQVEAFCAWYDAFIRGRNFHQQRKVVAQQKAAVTQKKATKPQAAVKHEPAPAPEANETAAAPVPKRSRITPERRQAFAARLRQAQRNLEAKQRREAKRDWDSTPADEWEYDFT